MDKVLAFLKDSYEEIKSNVTWPKYDELQKSSTLVLVASLIFAVLVGAVDFAFKNGMQYYYDLFRQ
ncbi:MAG: preprotein translocase subunit SecE [Bacteroidota bacterium]